MEEKHSLIPDRQLGTGNISTFCPCMRFALDKNFLVFIPKIEIMGFQPIDADIYRYIRFQIQPLFCKEVQSENFEISTNMCIAF